MERDSALGPHPGPLPSTGEGVGASDWSRLSAWFGRGGGEFHYIRYFDAEAFEQGGFGALVDGECVVDGIVARGMFQDRDGAFLGIDDPVFRDGGEDFCANSLWFTDGVERVRSRGEMVWLA